MIPPSSRFALLLAATLSLLLPIAAAEDCEKEKEAPGVPLDYYLLKDEDGKLGASGLPPSAKNETSWSTRVHPQDEGPLTPFQTYLVASKKVRLTLPEPDYVLDESKGVRGEVRASARLLSDAGDPIGLPWSLQFTEYSKVLHVDLVEGKRSVNLARASLHDHPYSLKFDGAYPGHDKPGCGPNSTWPPYAHPCSGSGGAAPHTHGDGSDPDRGLFLSDLAIELEFRLESNFPTQSLSHGTYQFTVQIDGRSFVHLEAVPEVAPKPMTAPDEADEDAEASDEDSEDEEETASEDEHDQSSPGAPRSAQVVSSDVATVGMVSAGGVLSALAVAGAAWLGLRRRTP